MDEDILLPFDLPAVGRKKVSVGFDGGMLSSDGGVLLLRDIERRLGLGGRLGGGPGGGRGGGWGWGSGWRAAGGSDAIRIGSSTAWRRCCGCGCSRSRRATRTRTTAPS